MLPALGYAVACSALLACSGSIGSGDATTRKTSMPTPLPIETPAAAMAHAARLTGLDTLTDEIQAKPCTVGEDQPTPFLAQTLRGTACWDIEYRKVSLRLAGALPNFKDAQQREFVVRMRRDSGQLLSIVSAYRGDDPDFRPTPSAAVAEAQLRGQDEQYTALPAQPPKLNFLAALSVVLHKGIGSPFLAKEIQAQYVMHARGDEAARAVWVITLNGLPPIPVDGPYGDSIPAWQRNHMRNVVDDATGVNLFGTNSPQPR